MGEKEIDGGNVYKKMCVFELIVDGLLNREGIPIGDYQAAGVLEFYYDLMDDIKVLAGVHKSEEAKTDGC